MCSSYYLFCTRYVGRLTLKVSDETLGIIRKAVPWNDEFFVRLDFYLAKLYVMYSGSCAWLQMKSATDIQVTTSYLNFRQSMKILHLSCWVIGRTFGL